MDARATYPIDTDELAAELSQVVTRLRRALQRSARAHLDGESLSPTEIELLLLVAERPGVGVADAASELGAAPNTVSTLIRKLVDLGLLRREFNRGDRRVAHLSLTAEAETRLARWRTRRAEVLTETFDHLEPEQLLCLHDAVAAMESLSSALYRPRRRRPIRRDADGREAAGTTLVLADEPVRPAPPARHEAWAMSDPAQPYRAWSAYAVGDASRI